jgi:hypothetical protein
MKNLINRAQDGQRKAFFPPVAKKKFSILTVIFLLSLCNTCLAQAVNKPSPDMVRHQIREGQVKEIHYTFGTDDTITFYEDGQEYLASTYTRYLHDAQDRLTYGMMALGDSYRLDTIIYANNIDKRPIYKITGYSYDLNSIDFRDVKTKNCDSYERLFYQGNECEPYASIYIFIIDGELDCWYSEYTYSDFDEHGNWTEMVQEMYLYEEITPKTMQTLCDFKLSPQKRQQIETKIIETVKKKYAIKDSKSDDSDDAFSESMVDYNADDIIRNWSVDYSREIIYY